jgi:hypothetical protein
LAYTYAPPISCSSNRGVIRSSDSAAPMHRNAWRSACGRRDDRQPPHDGLRLK